MKTLNIMLAALLLFVTLAHSADGTYPVLQLGSYEVIPQNLYPGTTGQLELTLKNTGSETAKGSVVYYTYGLDQDWSVYLGDVGANSEAITTIPFKVPEKLSSGIFVISVDIYYLDEDETGSKHTMASIPLTVSQHQVLEVRTVSLSSTTIGRGEKLSTVLEITNTGGVMKNLVISGAENSSFSLDGTTQKRVGDIDSNTSRNVTIGIVSSSSAAEGKYSIPLVLTYNDALQNEISQTIYVGPVMVSGSSSQLRISCEPVSGSEIGSMLKYNITVQNRGNDAQSAVVVVNGTGVFTPIGINTFYLDDIPPDESRSVIVSLGVDAASASGYYALPILMKVNGDEQEYDAGIFVQATPAITLTSEAEAEDDGTQVTIKISNTGNTAIRSVYVKAESTDDYGIIGTSEKFIGTLSVDDYATFQVTVNPRRQGTSGASAGVPVTIVFKDNDNAEHTIKASVPAASSAAFAATTADAATSTAIRPGTYEGRMPGGAQTQNILLYAGIGVLILGGLFLGYRKLKGKPKKPEA